MAAPIIRHLAGSGMFLAALVIASASAHRSATGPGGIEGTWVGKKAPAIADGRWINGTALPLDSLRGKVVLLEFWTFGCYNCRNTIPAMNGWFRNYGGEQFTVIGIHTPEFDREKELEIVRREVKRLGIRYPVVTDNEYTTWEAYNQRFWPALYLIDRQGIVRYVHFGEGAYEETERHIRLLLGLGT